MKSKLPGNKLTVIIRNDAPVIYCNDAPNYRSVTIELTNEQLQKLALRWIETSGGCEHYETISKCFIEPDDYDEK